jgi:phage gpG-like protein
MSGVEVILQHNDKAIAGLGAIVAKLDNPAPMWDVIGAYGEVSTIYRFLEERGPDNNPWPKSLRALATGGQTLTDSARLRNSFTHNVLANGVEWGTNVEYAASHQFGVTIRAKTSKGLRWKFAKQGGNKDSFVTKMEVTLPPRPFLGLNAMDEEIILEKAAHFLRPLDDR